MRSLDLGTVDVHQFSHTEDVIHKVWIGPLDTVSQADATVLKLNEIQHQDYKIVFSEALAP
jgi:hypothetical protein